MTGRKELFTVFAVLIMLAVPFAAVFTDNSDSSATTSDDSAVTTGTYNVYANDGTGWCSDRVYTYDAAQAVKASSMWVANDTDTATKDVMVEKHIPKTTPSDYVTYNWQTYGNISKFMGKINTTDNVWNVFVHVNGSWQNATVNLGSYKCFDDYDINYRTANICLYYGPSTTSAASITSAINTYMANEKTSNAEVELAPITSIVDNEDFAVYFELQVVYQNANLGVTGTVTDIFDDVVSSQSFDNAAVVSLVGYGSDAYLALKDAVGSSNISAVESIPGSGYSSYSWINSMFNIGTIQTAGTATPSDWMDDRYAYWCIYDTVGAEEVSHLADFVIGAYSPLESAGSDFTENNFRLIYQEVVM